LVIFINLFVDIYPPMSHKEHKVSDYAWKLASGAYDIEVEEAPEDIDPEVDDLDLIGDPVLRAFVQTFRDAGFRPDLRYFSLDDLGDEGVKMEYRFGEGDPYLESPEDAAYRILAVVDLEQRFVSEVDLSVRARRKGLGRRLVETNEELWRMLGIEEVFLGTIDPSDAAIQFWSAMGYDVSTGYKKLD
jgi:GNAT superfamily N-acetyltransferase